MEHHLSIQVVLATRIKVLLGTSRILSLELAETRPLSHVRIVLDTSRTAGWNEIDAIGLVPRAQR